MGWCGKLPKASKQKRTHQPSCMKFRAKVRYSIDGHEDAHLLHLSHATDTIQVMFDYVGQGWYQFSFRHSYLLHVSCGKDPGIGSDWTVWPLRLLFNQYLRSYWASISLWFAVMKSAPLQDLILHYHFILWELVIAFLSDTSSHHGRSS